MEQFSAVSFYIIATILETIKREDTNHLLEDETKTYTGKQLQHLASACKQIGLRLSALCAEELARFLLSGQVNQTYHHLATQASVLSKRIQDEMALNTFMYIPSDRSPYFNQPELFGKDVNQKFPEIQYDLVEAGNCYAAGRSTAVVFHLMRIMEKGVQEFGKKLGVTFVNEKNWHNILDEINKKVKSLNSKDKTTVLMAQASANLYSVKLAWRNEVMHPKDTYTTEEAENLIRQVKLFMEQLAGFV